jgi:hypothetical protein
MDTNLNTAGYDLYEVSEDHWALNVKGGAIFVGTFKKVVIYAVLRLGFKLEEIEYATREMINKDHNGAHFGMYRGFIFTFQKEFKHVKDLKKVS